jgi:rhodanese-related sulfurtransferase
VLQISFQQLQEWILAQKKFVLIDVRETFEHEHFNIGGINIPLNELMNNFNQLPQDTDIVLYCAKGIRSVIAIQKLETKGYTQLYNLSSGISSLQSSI